VIIENDQYSGTVSWNPGDNPFEAGTFNADYSQPNNLNNLGGLVG